ncbi:hypothetical protein QZH41_017183 [Actinostola sp. cb2023]|nr:hypothetical protein QZH41_017183 [Actinostola sp. cb2023]
MLLERLLMHFTTHILFGLPFFLLSSDAHGEDKIREGIEPMIQAIRLLLKRKRYEEVVNIKIKVLDLYQSIENFAMMYKTTLGLIVVYLHESDYVAADQCFKNSFSIPGFSGSDEAEAAEKVLECFDEGDADGMKTCTSQPLFTYLDNEIAKLARSLRVPGDLPGNPPRPSIKNELFDKPEDVELDDQFDNEQESTEETKPEEEDEFAGGLC